MIATVVYAWSGDISNCFITGWVTPAGFFSLWRNTLDFWRYPRKMLYFFIVILLAFGVRYSRKILHVFIVTHAALVVRYACKVIHVFFAQYAQL